MDLITKSKIIPIIEELKSDCTSRKKKETFEIQVTIKGYDFQKDDRFNKSCELPNEKRFREKICVLGGDQLIEEEAKKLGIPFKHFNEITGNSKEKTREKKKLTLKYDGFIIHGRFNKHFNIKFVVQKRKNFFLIANVNELSSTIEKAKKTVQFKLRKNPDIGFPIGTTEMETEKIFENYEVGMNNLIGILKKGTKNLQVVTLKTNQSKPINLL